MKVGKLKKLLESADDDMEVVVPGRDHSYRLIYHATKVPAELHKGEYFEYHGKEHFCDETSEVADVFVIE